MEKYLTYEEYQELGGELPEAPFNLLEYEARKQIDKYTFGRLMELEELPEDIADDIKNCMMVLIKQDNEKQTTTAKKSESIDGYSVSFNGSTEYETLTKNTVKLLLNGIKLNGVPLLYTGGVNDNKRIYYPIS
jgi:hypothetical protein